MKGCEWVREPMIEGAERPNEIDDCEMIACHAKDRAAFQPFVFCCSEKSIDEKESSSLFCVGAGASSCQKALGQSNVEYVT